jgi:hypothetical protein
VEEKRTSEEKGTTLQYFEVRVAIGFESECKQNF